MNGLIRREAFARGSIFHNYIITYTTILLLPCFILGLFLFNRATTQIQENAENAEQYKTEQLSSLLSSEFDDIIAILNKITVSNSQYLVNSDNLVFQPYRWKEDKYNRTELIWELNRIKNYNLLVDDCILYYREYNMIFTSSIEADSESFFDKKFSIDNYDQFRHILDTADNCTLTSANITDQTTHDEYSALLYIVPFRLEKIMTKDMVMVFIIKAESLDQWSRFILGTDRYNINLYNKDGTHLFTYGHNPDSSSRETNSSISNTQLQNQGNKRNISFQSYIDSLNLLIVLETSWDHTLQQLMEFRKLLLVISIITILIGFMLVILFSYINYFPLRNTLKSLKEHLPSPEYQSLRNEYKQLDSAVKATITRNKNLEDHINDQSKTFYKQILIGLLSGSIQYEKLDKTFDISINLPGPHYCVLAVPLLTSGLPLKAHNQSIYTVTVVDMPSYHCTAILMSLHDNSNTLCSQAVDEVFGMIASENQLAMGVSSLHHGIGDLNLCMIEAIISLNDIEKQKKTGIQYYNDLHGQQFQLELTPESILFEFSQSLKNGNEEQCIEIYSNIMDAIETQKNPIAEQIQYYNIGNTVLKIIRELNLKEITITANYLELFLNIAMFRKNMKMILIQICRNISKYKSDHRDDIYTDIFHNIDNHYLDYDFSLERLASDYGLSVSTISKHFKKSMGIGFREFITKKRLERAKQMLCSTSMSVHEISVAIGYYNESNFIKRFKIQDGITPNEYRKRYGQMKI